MLIRNPVLFELKGLPISRAADSTIQMDQATFRAFYDQTARPVWAFLLRRTGSEQQADDLLQETYYRFLRTRRPYENDTHRRNYLFRIAANVANDAARKRTEAPLSSGSEVELLASPAPDTERLAEKKTDLARALETLPVRQRQAVWLAYAEGSSHKEIARILGIRQSSIKPMLFRARSRLAAWLRTNSGEGC